MKSCVIGVLSVMAAFSIGSVGAQTFELEPIFTESSLGEQCEDVAPFDDDFGWNGSCSCLLSESDRYSGFGQDSNNRQTVTQGDLSLFGSTGSPGGCFGSGSVTVFRFGPTPERLAEIVSSTRSQGDGFGSGDDLLAVSDTHIAVGARTGLVTVFGTDDFAERAVIDLGIDFVSFAGLQFIGDDLISRNSEGVGIYRSSDWSLQQSFPAFSVLANTSDEIAFQNEGAVEIHTRGADGLFVLTQTIPPGQIGEDEFTLTDFKGDFLLRAAFTADTIVVETYIRGDDGIWIPGSENNEFERPNFTAELDGENLVYLPIDENSVEFYSFSIDNGWQLEQALALPASNGQFPQPNDLTTADNRAMVFGNDTGFPGGFVTILEKDDAGIWSTLGDLELPADSSEGMFSDTGAVLPRRTSEPSGFYFVNLSDVQTPVENPAEDTSSDGGQQDSDADSDNNADTDSDAGNDASTDDSAGTDANTGADESNIAEGDSVTGSDPVSSDSGGGSVTPGLFLTLVFLLLIKTLFENRLYTTVRSNQ